MERPRVEGAPNPVKPGLPAEFLAQELCNDTKFWNGLLFC